MDISNHDIAQRIRSLREDLGIGADEMAALTGCTAEQYRRLEDGKEDFSASFIYKVADRCGVDMVELMTGESPRLSDYTLVRAGGGAPIARRAGFDYRHLAAHFKHKLAEPLLVTAPYDVEAERAPIPLSRHEGQEFDFILSGQLKIEIDGHVELMNAEDSIFYDSGNPHGMVAAGGQECRFLAVLLKR
ncbi:MAG: cupin domain-containing protein [Oscillospiraceae bacterium]|nr:cupin domain-containing protein [Oscillospiraceae bacterium]